VRRAQGYAAWGLDRRDRPVILYVARGTVGRRDLREAVTSDTSPQPGDGSTGRVLALGTHFETDLLGSPPLLDDWGLELLLWRTGVAQAAGEIVIEVVDAGDSEREDSSVSSSAAAGDEPIEPQQGETAMKAGGVLLTAEEVESLVGASPPGRGSRA